MQRGEELTPADMGTAKPGFTYGSSKTYTHSVGLSCCFRQWRAKSHCRFLHGYALKVHIEFEATELDIRNWVADFGALKPIKQWLEDTFDHKTVVASDDPDLNLFKMLGTDPMPTSFQDVTSARHREGSKSLIQLVVLPSVGVESFARYIFEHVDMWLKNPSLQMVDPSRELDLSKVSVSKVTVSEHEGNSAWYGRSGTDYNKVVQLIREFDADRTQGGQIP